MRSLEPFVADSASKARKAVSGQSITATRSEVPGLQSDSEATVIDRNFAVDHRSVRSEWKRGAKDGAQRRFSGDRSLSRPSADDLRKTLSRFFAKTVIRGTCLIWTGAKSYDGRRGYFRAGKGNTVQVSHFALRLTGVRLRAGQRLLHRCGDPLCVNPLHILPATVGNLLWMHGRRSPNGCWEWTGKRHRRGYGVLKLRGEEYLAHRVAYQTWVGAIPARKNVLHTCSTRSCINPAHLVCGAGPRRNGSIGKNALAASSSRTPILHYAFG